MLVKNKIMKYMKTNKDSKTESTVPRLGIEPRNTGL